MFLLPAALLVAWASPARRRGAIALVLGIAAVIAPVTWHNWSKHQERVLISWNGGVNLYAANHPTYDQRAGNGTHEDLELLEHVCKGMMGLTICPLADAAVMPMESFLDKFRPEFEALIQETATAGATSRWPRGEQE